MDWGDYGATMTTSEIKKTGVPPSPAGFPPPGDGVSDLELFRSLHFLRRLVYRARLGNEHSQARLLELISRQGSIDQKELLAMFPVRAASMSQLLRKLENQGLISRPRQEDDMRRSNVEITEAGRAEAQARDSRLCDNLDQFFNCLTIEERHTLKAILVKLTENLLEALKSSGVDVRL